MDAPPAPFSQSLAVVVGIDQYHNGLPALSCAVNDATAVAGLFAGPLHRYQVLQLLDQEATLAGLRTLLHQTLPDRVQADSQLLLYFAGHGVREDHERPVGYFLPQDAGQDPDGFLPMAEVQEALDRLPCRHLLVVLDCCFAGAFRWASGTRDIRRAARMMYRERYQRYIADRAWQALTSSACDQRALDVVAGWTLGARVVAHGHSPFAQALLDGLGQGKAEQRCDGVVTATELYLYLRERLEPESAALGIRQTPGLWPLAKHDKGEFIFLVRGATPDLAPAPTLSAESNPYRGLNPFAEEHAELFFGREHVVRDLLQTVAAQPLTTVLGVSGSGKSSVVMAGLLPRLRARGWTVLPVLRPGRAPLSALAESLRELDGPQAAELQRADSALTLFLTAWQAAHLGQTLVLVIDQLEELVTLREGDGAEAERLIAVLARALAERPEALRIVLTLRADFEPQMAESELKLWWAKARFVLPAMTQDELRACIEGPAVARVIYFDTARLADQIINEVVQMPGALPLLSFTLSELYLRYAESGKEDRTLTAADYQHLGGVIGSLRNRAQQLYDRLESDAARATMKRMILRMVALEGGELARRRVMHAELAFGVAVEDRRVAAVLRQLSSARLVVEGQDASGEHYVEPAHDALVSCWDSLWRWQQTEHESLRLQRRVGLAAQEWLRRGRERRLLWANDPRLPQVRQLAQEHAHWLNALEQEFVDRSTERRRQQSRSLATIVTLVIVGLSGLSLYAWSKRGAAEQALAQTYQELGRQRLIEGDVLRALVFLAAAYERDPADPTLRFLLARASAAAAEQRVLAGHTGALRAAVFSRDGAQVSTLSLDKSARRWEVGSGRPLPALAAPAQTVFWRAVLSSDGRQVAAPGSDGRVRLWGLAGGPVRYLTGHSGKDAVSFSADGAWLMTGGLDGPARVWDTASGVLRATLPGPAGAARGVYPSADGQQSVTVDKDGVARLHRWAQGGSYSLDLHTLPVVDVAFSPDGSRLVTAAVDGTARLWDTQSGACLRTLKGPGSVVSLATFSPDGTRVVTAGDDRCAVVWDAASGRRVAALDGHCRDVQSAAFSADGRLVVTASTDRTARVWDARSGQVVQVLRGHSEQVLNAAFSPDGTRVVTASQDQTARVWRMGGPATGNTIPGRACDAFEEGGPGGPLRLLTCGAYMTAEGNRPWAEPVLWDAEQLRPLASLKGHTATVDRALFSPDGQRLLTSGRDGAVRLWDRAGRELAMRSGLSQYPAARFSPDGARVLLHGPQEERRLWSLGTNVERALPIGADLRGATFSPDGTRVLAFSTWVGVWDARSGAALGVLAGHTDQILAHAFDSAGRLLATASADNNAWVWDAVTGTPRARLEGHAHDIYTIGFSRDGRQIVTGSGDGTARVWTVGGRLLAILDGNEACASRQAAVFSAGFSPDGRWVITGANDAKARIFSAATGKLLAVLEGHAKSVRRAHFLGDGSRALTASDDGTTRLWDVRLEQRSAAEVNRAAACRAPFRLVDNQLVPAAPDLAACAQGSLRSIAWERP